MPAAKSTKTKKVAAKKRLPKESSSKQNEVDVVIEDKDNEEILLQMNDIVNQISSAFNKEDDVNTVVDFDAIRKKIASQNCVSIDTLLTLKNYFATVCCSDNINKTYGDNSLKLLRLLIDVLNHQNDQVIILALQITSKVAILSYQHSKEEDIVPKYTKLLFHITKQFYKQADIQALLFISNDIQLVLRLCHRYETILPADVMKLYFTLQQMFYSIYSKHLSKYVQTGGSDLMNLLFLRMNGLILTSYQKDWKEQKFCESIQDFVKQWCKVVLQVKVIGLSSIVPAVLRLITRIQQLLNEENDNSQLINAEWKFHYFLTFSIIQQKAFKMSVLNNFDCSQKMENLFKILLLLSKLSLSGISSLKCNQLWSTLELINESFNSFNPSIDQLLDIFQLLRMLCSNTGILACRKSIIMLMNTFSQMFATNSLENFLADRDDSKRKLTVQLLIQNIAFVFEQFQLLFTNDKGVCRCSQNDLETQDSLKASYSLMTEHCFKFTEKCYTFDIKMFQYLSSLMYKLSLTMYNHEEFALACLGFQFSCDTLEFLTNVDDKTIKEVSAKVNMLIKCLVRMNDLESAYKNSKDLLDYYSKLDSVEQYESLLQAQVQYSVKLKFDSLKPEQHDKMRPIYGADCGKDTEFRLIILLHEYNAYKKLSHKLTKTDLLVELIDLRRDLFEENGDLLNYSLMMLELSFLQGCDRTKRHHWCSEAQSVLEGMNNELDGSGDSIEWHVKDILAVTYFQLAVLQYEDKICQNIDISVEQATNDVTASCVDTKESENVEDLHDGFFDQQFISSLNFALELWSEVCQEALKRNDVEFTLKNPVLAAECLYSAAVLYSLMSQNFFAIQASYLSGMIYNMLMDDKPDTDYTEKLVTSWSYTTSCILSINDFCKAEQLVQKLQKMKLKLKSHLYHQIDVLNAAYLLKTGEIKEVLQILENILKDPLLQKTTKTALSIKSEVYHLLTYSKLFPTLKNDDVFVEEEHFPVNSPFPPILDCLKYLRGLYYACLNENNKNESSLSFSSDWRVLDKLLNCLDNYSEMLKQQGSVLESKSYLKEALLLSKKHQLSLRVPVIIQKIAAIDLILDNQDSFNKNFEITSTILKPSIDDCFQDDQIYLPDFVEHVEECSCVYCLYPKLQEIHINFYLQYIESKKKFEKLSSKNHTELLDLVSTLVENAEIRFQKTFSNICEVLQLEKLKIAEEDEAFSFKSTTSTTSKKTGRKTTKAKKKNGVVEKTVESLTLPSYFSKFDIEARISQVNNSPQNSSEHLCIQQLINKFENTTTPCNSQHEHNRLIAQLYCVRSMLHAGDLMSSKKNITDANVEVSNKKGRKQVKAKRGRGKTKNNVDDQNDVTENNEKLNIGTFIEDLQKALLKLNSFTDTLIIKSIYQLISSVSCSNNVLLTTSTQLLASARTLHQQVLSSCGKKLQKLECNKLTKEAMLTTCDILQKYSEPDFIFSDENIQTLIDEHIPKGWRICNLFLSHIGNRRKSLILTRVEANKKPLVINIELDTDSDQPIGSFGGVCDLASAFDEDPLELFDRLLKENKESMKLEDKTDWWNERNRLNERIKSLLSRLERDWLFGWKALLFGTYKEEKDQTKLQDIVKDVYEDIKQELDEEIDEDLIKVFVDGFEWCTKRELLSAINTISKDGQRIYEIIEHHVPSSEKSDEEKKHSHNRLPVVFILDKEKGTFQDVYVKNQNLQVLPWECLPCLLNQPISRMPSLLLTVTHCMRYKSLLNDGVSTRNTFYMLNPRNDLKRTEEKFADSFKSEGWEGIIGRPPTQNEFIKALTDHDLFIYCGHGSGKEYLGWDSIQKLECRAVSILMGCSSGKLTVPNALEANGMVQYYLLAGCPAVVANLWDVTDKDIDSYLEECLRIWMKDSSSRKLTLVECVQEARRVCKLSYLNGAAPVVYGLPFSVRDLETKKLTKGVREEKTATMSTKETKTPKSRRKTKK